MPAVRAVLSAVLDSKRWAADHVLTKDDNNICTKEVSGALTMGRKGLWGMGGYHVTLPTSRQHFGLMGTGSGNTRCPVPIDFGATHVAMERLLDRRHESRGPQASDCHSRYAQ